MTRFVVNAFFKKIFKNKCFPDFPAFSSGWRHQNFVLEAHHEKIARSTDTYSFIKVDPTYDRKTD
jgi:hypothetical protein